MKTLLLLFALAITAYAGFATWLILRYRSRGGVVEASPTSSVTRPAVACW